MASSAMSLPKISKKSEARPATKAQAAHETDNETEILYDSHDDNDVQVVPEKSDLPKNSAFSMDSKEDGTGKRKFTPNLQRTTKPRIGVGLGQPRRGPKKPDSSSPPEALTLLEGLFVVQTEYGRQQPLFAPKPVPMKVNSIKYKSSEGFYVDFHATNPEVADRKRPEKQFIQNSEVKNVRSMHNDLNEVCMLEIRFDIKNERTKLLKCFFKCKMQALQDQVSIIHKTLKGKVQGPSKLEEQELVEFVQNKVIIDAQTSGQASGTSERESSSSAPKRGKSAFDTPHKRKSPTGEGVQEDGSQEIKRPRTTPTSSGTQQQKYDANDTLLVFPFSSNHAKEEEMDASTTNFNDTVTVMGRDFETLRDNEFLNDTVMDFYVKYIEHTLGPEVRSKCYFFSSFFWKKLSMHKCAEDSYESVSKWTKKVDIFEKEFLFVPICEDLHWTLAVICAPAGIQHLDSTEGAWKAGGKLHSILYLDSMGGLKKEAFRRLADYLRLEWNAKRKDQAQLLPIGGKKKRSYSGRNLPVPKQDNCSDCGIFVLEYIERFTKDFIEESRDYEKWSDEDIRKWFKLGEIKNKRTQIKQVIQSQKEKRDAVLERLKAQNMSEHAKGTVPADSEPSNQEPSVAPDGSGGNDAARTDVSGEKMEMEDQEQHQNSSEDSTLNHQPQASQPEEPQNSQDSTGTEIPSSQPSQDAMDAAEQPPRRSTRSSQQTNQ